MTGQEALNTLVGRELASIEFVRDYVQLRFDGPVLSAYTLPVLRAQGRAETSPGVVGYCDALVGLIGTSVESTSVRPDESLKLVFAGGREVEISLRSEDALASDAAEFGIDGGGTWLF